jgi:hypothetical protein
MSGFQIIEASQNRMAAANWAPITPGCSIIDSAYPFMAVTAFPS